MRLRPLDRFLRLTPADRLLLVQSVVLLGAARLGLWLLPLTVVRRLLARTAPTPSGALATPERLAAALAGTRLVARPARRWRPGPPVGQTGTGNTPPPNSTHVPTPPSRSLVFNTNGWRL